MSIERRLVTDITDKNILHIGSGRNVDFIIYKNSQPGECTRAPNPADRSLCRRAAQSDSEPVQFSSRFKVFMTDKKTGEVHQENRILRLWFHDFAENQSLYEAQELMRMLLKSDEFPRGETRRARTPIDCLLP